LTHEEYKEMLAAYALGALDGAEARALEEHLDSCLECPAEIVEWRETASALALSAAPVEPPKELRARLLESVRTLKQGASDGRSGAGETTTAAADVAAVADAEAEGGAQTVSNVIRMPVDTRGRWSAPVRLGAIAAAVAIISLAATLFIVWNRLNSLERQYEREHTAVEVLARQLAEEREVRELLTAPGARTTQLAGTSAAQQASARLAFDPQTGRAMLFAYNLPPAPAGKAYQLWYIADLKHPVPGGVFNPDARGGVVMHDRVPEEGRNASIFAVTLEPQGGVSAPTGDKYLLSPIS
jgi:anti-sigma-K factor RskA